MSDDTPPDPLVPPEVDLRDFDFMPLQGARLFASDTWALCSAEEKVAALTLWWSSWHEEPAGSLTDNRRTLARAAGYGVAVDAFNAVAENALRGWVKCSDGRLYHPVVASIALEVWEKKTKKKAENAADRERKHRKRHGTSGGNGGDVRRTDAKIPAENALKGREGDTGSSLRSEPAAPKRRPATRLPDDWQPTVADITHARDRGFGDDQIRDIADAFRTYWTAGKGRNHTHADWPASWRNWINRETPKGTHVNGARPGAKPSPHATLFAAAAEIAREDADR